MALAFIGPAAVVMATWQLTAGSNASAAVTSTPPPQASASTGGGAGATVVPAVVPTRSFAGPPPRAGFHEFPADCTVTHLASDDPIVFPGVPGAAHNHTFIGNLTT